MQMCHDTCELCTRQKYANSPVKCACRCRQLALLHAAIRASGGCQRSVAQRTRHSAPRPRRLGSWRDCIRGDHADAVAHDTEPDCAMRAGPHSVSVGSAQQPAAAGVAAEPFVHSHDAVLAARCCGAADGGADARARGAPGTAQHRSLSSCNFVVPMLAVIRYQNVDGKAACMSQHLCADDLL